MKMYEVDGIKLFHGTVRVTPVIRADGTRWREPFDRTGTWVYRPEQDTWYCHPDGEAKTVYDMIESYPPRILSDFREVP